jgi:hypothetical protein
VDSSATRPTGDGPFVYRTEDTALSRRGGGFDSLTGYSNAQGVGKPGNPPALGAGERRFESGRPDWTRSSEWRFLMIRLKHRHPITEPAGSWCNGSTADF